jgi:hypothetical protein
MTTQSDAIIVLANAKTALQAQCDAADGATLNKLISTIHNISSEIDALASAALNNADYVPATNPFKRTTDEAKIFLTTLNQLKSRFSDISAVANALDSVTKLVTKLGLA